jgi:hypothetical protein
MVHIAIEEANYCTESFTLGAIFSIPASLMIHKIQKWLKTQISVEIEFNIVANSTIDLNMLLFSRKSPSRQHNSNSGL